MSLSKAIQSTRSRWEREAELNFLARLKQGVAPQRATSRNCATLPAMAWSCSLERTNSATPKPRKWD